MIHKLAAFQGLTDQCHVNEKELRRDLSSSGQRQVRGLVAVDEDKYAGFCLFYPSHYSSFSNTWGLEIHDLFVEEDFRGQHIGLKLIHTVAFWANTEKENLPRIRLQVLEDNLQAKAFYENLGGNISPSCDGEHTVRFETTALLERTAHLRAR